MHHRRRPFVPNRHPPPTVRVSTPLTILKRPWDDGAAGHHRQQVLLQGEAFSGKTALMAHTAVTSGFPFIRKIAADELIGMGEVNAQACCGRHYFRGGANEASRFRCCFHFFYFSSRALCVG